MTLGIANGGVGTAQINADQVQRRVTGQCALGQYVRAVAVDGAVTCGTDATGTSGWGLTGNTGTNPATNFIGTTDAQPFVVRTRNVQSLRIEPSTVLFNGAPNTANVIAGSSVNAVTAGVRGATISGGGVPAEGDNLDFGGAAPNQVTDHYGTVGGGYGNQAGDADGTVADRSLATVGGGSGNTASGGASTVGGGQGNTADGLQSTIAGGQRNTVRSPQSTIAGGRLNTASGPQSTVGGGDGNVASGIGSTVAGGYVNTASGRQSTVGGGAANCAGGSFSWAGGLAAAVRPGANAEEATLGCSQVPSAGEEGDVGTFMWADAQGIQGLGFVSTGPNQFGVRAAGGVFFGGSGVTSADIPDGRFINTSTGAHLTTGGTWTNASSRALKTAFEAIDASDILGRVLALQLTRWQYRDSPAEGAHLGPVAEDFYAAFGLGADGRAISTVDASGVALAAIQGLNAKLEAQRDVLHERVEMLDAARDAEVAALRGENAALRARLEAIEARLGVGQ